MDISFKISGDLQKRLEKAAAAQPGLVKKAVQESVILMWNKASKVTPKWGGDLRKNMSYKVIGLRGVVSNKLKHAVYVHEGTRPHWIGKKVWGDENSDFAKWARGHGIPPFLLARSIARKGTKPQPWMRDTFEKHEKDVIKIFEKSVDKILKMIEK